MGVSQFEGAISTFGWAFHGHDTIDFGIDGHVETCDVAGDPSGAHVAVQIKGGPSEFDEPSPYGWWFRFEARHYRYWTGYCLPVYVVLVDINTGEFYWQRVTPDRIVSTGKGWKIEISRSNDSSAAERQWHLEAGGQLDEALARAELVAQFLPPNVAPKLEPLRAATPDVAAHLTAHLGGSAGSPQLAVRALIDGAPHWLRAAPGEAWEVVAAFAGAHELHREAADAFLVAAEVLPARSGMLLTAAASQLIDTARDEARAVLSRVDGVPEERRLVLELVRAMLEHPAGDANPVAEPALLTEDPDATRDSALAQAFLGGNATRRGDVGATVEHCRRALELQHDDSNLMLELAEAHRRRALTAASRPDDITEAVRLADAAHRQRQRWRGPVAAALTELLKALFVRGDYTEVLRRALPEPAGIAGAEEAAYPAVLALACQAAIVTGQDALATRLVSQMPESARRAQLELHLVEEGDPEFAVKLEAILERAIEEGDAETIARAVLRLSEHGVDRTDEAQRLRELGIVPDQHVRLPRAILLARHDLDAALPDLRALAADDPVAAETLVRLLARHGRHDEALDELAALPEALRVSEHDLRVLVLLEAGRDSDAENAAVDALSDSTLSSADRRRLHQLLATRAAQRDDPHAVITWCRRAIGDANASAADPVVVWWLIAAQLNVGRLDDARVTYQHYQPEVRTRDQVQTWAALHRAGGWDGVSLEKGLELAQTWADDVNVSAGLLMTMVMGTSREGSPDKAVDPNDVRRRIWLEVERHCDRYGDSSPIQQVPFDPDKPDDFFNRFRDSLQVRSEVLGKVTRAVQLLQAPLGLLAEAAGRPYALAVIQRAAGLTPACAPAEDEYDLELNAAQSFISARRGARAVTDAPALNLTGLLDVAEVIREAGIRLVLPRASRLDIQFSLIEATQLLASPGSLLWDASSDEPVLHEVSPEQQNEILRRTQALDAAATHCDVVVEGSLQELAGGASERSAPWLAPLRVALDHGLPLWSDDVVLRRMARESGVATFGTLALLHALGERDAQAIDEARQEQILGTLLTEWVVDGPWTVPQLVQRAEAPAAPLAPVLGALARPWRYADPQERIDAAEAVVASKKADPELHRQWFTAVAYGMALAHPQPAAGAMTVAAVAAAHDADPVAALLEYVRWLRRLFAAHLLPGEPADHLDLVVPALRAAGHDPDTVLPAVRAQLSSEGPDTQAAPRSTPSIGAEVADGPAFPAEPEARAT